MTRSIALVALLSFLLPACVAPASEPCPGVVGGVERLEATALGPVPDSELLEDGTLVPGPAMTFVPAGEPGDLVWFAAENGWMSNAHRFQIDGAGVEEVWVDCVTRPTTCPTLDREPAYGEPCRIDDEHLESFEIGCWENVVPTVYVGVRVLSCGAEVSIAAQPAL